MFLLYALRKVNNHMCMNSWIPGPGPGQDFPTQPAIPMAAPTELSWPGPPMLALVGLGREYNVIHWWLRQAWNTVSEIFHFILTLYYPFAK